MTRRVQRIAAAGGALWLGLSPVIAAAQGNPFQQQSGGSITTPQGRAGSETMLSTKPVPTAPAQPLPWQEPAPVPVAQPGAQAVPQPIPFGRPSANVFERGVALPGSVRAVPVENIDAIEASEPAPAVATPHEADPVNEDPAAPTELTAPIFTKPDVMIPRKTVLRVLNKVTARAQEITLAPGETVPVSTIEIKAQHCQLSAENSQPDAAVLLSVTEPQPEQAPPKKLFEGWVYQSSPSVSALEHPIYDITLLRCEDTVKAAKPADKKENSKKKKR